MVLAFYSSLLEMMKGRYRNSKCLILGFSIIFIISVYLYNRNNKSRKGLYNVMIWWSPYQKHLDYHRKCGQIECRFTSDRKVKTDPLFTGYLFYGDEIYIRDLPSRRSKNEYWALYKDTSPKNVPFLLEAIHLFNFTSTFSRYSDIPLTLQSFTSLEELINYKIMYTFGEKTSFQHKLKLAPILYIQSQCDTLTGRELYVSELGKYVGIDSYGSCLKNKTFPNGIKDDSTNASEIRDFYDFVSKYKFIIVYQDLVCEDYIVEKFWKSLTLGVVPIYFGAKNIRNYLPNPNSAILIDDFLNPAELAQYVLRISCNEDIYTSFLYHKTSDFYPISNQLLLNSLFKEDMYYVKNRMARTIAEFECYVCVESFYGQTRHASQREFFCDLPYFPPGNATFKASTRVSRFLERTKLQASLVQMMVTGV